MKNTSRQPEGEPNRSFAESVNKQNTRNADYALFGIMRANMRELVSNAAHRDPCSGTRREDMQLKRVYVLAFALNSNGLIHVRFEVKKFENKDNSLYLTVTLHKNRDVVFTSENASGDASA